MTLIKKRNRLGGRATTKRSIIWRAAALGCGGRNIGAQDLREPLCPLWLKRFSWLEGSRAGVRIKKNGTTQSIAEILSRNGNCLLPPRCCVSVGGVQAA